jgi:DnaJ-class molecular chaperone
MADDYYKVLGISRDASADDIQKAYRQLARKHHPDMNPDDKNAKKRFQEVQAAFDVLNDPKKRELYDRYGSSFEQMAGAGAGPGGGPRPGGPGAGAGGFNFEDVDLSQFFGERYGGGEESSGGFGDIFNQFRRAGSAGKRSRRAAPKGEDVHYELEVPFNVTITGGEQSLRVVRPEGKTETITVKIPAGLEDGKTIRLRGQGESGMGSTPGDLLITVRAAAHPHFQRKGMNLHMRLPVTLAEAALGSKVDVPTPWGTVSLRVPAGTSSGAKLRVKGHGVRLKDKPQGDLFAEISIVIPKEIKEADRESLAGWDERYLLEPRGDLRW